MRNSFGPVGVIALGVYLFAPPALASETYPAAVQEALGLACAPACVLCHTRPEGGLQQINSFGEKVRDSGVSIRNPDGIPAALECIENGVDNPAESPCQHPAGEVRDSDGDGTPDIEELRNAEDPSSTQGGSFCGPSYGCGASIAPKKKLDGVASASALLMAGALLWSLRRLRA